jgi:thiamine biosynthesis lipoprotein ApbE
MIVVKEQNINKIDAILKDEGFDIFIKPVFQEYRFGIAKYTAALFHNEAFSEILQFFINCKELVFDGKRVLSIFITDYLKIDTT